ncbi:MAG: alanine--glyoxylate aminotransferase family protein, partial [Chloroflexi bacterium]|nr:alanine--glyoxylate aminotransferase family protein [Chloroflexota bacterium]
LNARAAEVLHQRRTKVQSWYLDLSLVERYWGQERFYHHTAPISMNFALREALRLIYEEGLEARWQRHRLNHQALLAGLQAMGLEPFVADEAQRLWSLNAVRIPSGIDDAKVRAQLLQEFGLEIGGGLGELKGRIWRVGLMGYSSSRRNVLLFLGALEHVLLAQGYAPQGSGVHAAGEVYRRAAKEGG